VIDREIKPVDRVRTRSRAIPRMVEFFEKDSPVEYVGVVHAQAAGEAEQVAADLRRSHPDIEVPVGQIGCVLGTHVGPKALGLVYLKK
jgi:fatty acid-binding protein DegV